VADFDFSDLARLDADLGAVEDKIIPSVTKAVEVSARLGRDEWQKRAKGPSGRMAKAYPRSIDYELVLDQDGAIGAEIGPNLGKSQGSLGILEDAPGDVRAKPQHAGRDTAKAIQADFVKGIELAEKEAFS